MMGINAEPHAALPGGGLRPAAGRWNPMGSPVPL
jgi:hypothetical protein